MKKKSSIILAKKQTLREKKHIEKIEIEIEKLSW